jgi:hypothetical protein
VGYAMLSSMVYAESHNFGRYVLCFFVLYCYVGFHSCNRRDLCFSNLCVLQDSCICDINTSLNLEFSIHIFKPIFLSCDSFSSLFPLLTPVCLAYS